MQCLSFLRSVLHVAQVNRLSFSAQNVFVVHSMQGAFSQDQQKVTSGVVQQMNTVLKDWNDTLYGVADLHEPVTVGTKKISVSGDKGIRFNLERFVNPALSSHMKSNYWIFTRVKRSL